MKPMTKVLLSFLVLLFLVVSYSLSSYSEEREYPDDQEVYSGDNNSNQKEVKNIENVEDIPYVVWTDEEDKHIDTLVNITNNISETNNAIFRATVNEDFKRAYNLSIEMIFYANEYFDMVDEEGFPDAFSEVHRYYGEAVFYYRRGALKLMKWMETGDVGYLEKSDGYFEVAGNLSDDAAMEVAKVWAEREGE